MSDDLLTYTLLCLSAFAAGAVNSIAGGGTLLTFPTVQHVLVRRLFEEAGKIANATRRSHCCPARSPASFGYRTELARMPPTRPRALVPSIAGGVVGSLLLTEFPSKVFDSLIPWLILTAATLFLLQGPLKRLTGHTQPKPPSLRTTTAVILAQFLSRFMAATLARASAF